MTSEDSQHPLPELFSAAEWVRLGRRLRLTPRQLQIARLICLGYSNSATAKRLGLATETIGMHTRGLYRRLAIRVRLGIPVRLVVESRTLRSRRIGRQPT